MASLEQTLKVLDQIYELADDSLTGSTDLSDAMWEIRESIEELMGVEDE